MSDLAKFLRARLNEDAATIKGLMEKSHLDAMSRDEFLADRTMRMVSGVDAITVAVVNRQIREVEVKRQIVELHDGSHECSGYDHRGDFNNCMWIMDGEDCTTSRLLALPYEDHPDFRGEWRP